MNNLGEHLYHVGRGALSAWMLMIITPPLAILLGWGFHWLNTNGYSLDPVTAYMLQIGGLMFGLYALFHLIFGWKWGTALFICLTVWMIL